MPWGLHQSPGAYRAQRHYLWLLDREGGKIGFVDAWPSSEQNVFQSIDRNRRPTDQDRVPGTGKTVNFCPSLWGGKDWPPEDLQPRPACSTLPANNHLLSRTHPAGRPEIPEASSTSASRCPFDPTCASAKAKKSVGEIQAWDMKTGKRVWTRTPGLNWGHC